MCNHTPWVFGEKDNTAKSLSIELWSSKMGIGENSVFHLCRSLQKRPRDCGNSQDIEGKENGALNYTTYRRGIILLPFVESNE
ncbi:hypothetical protein TNCT_347681 [Trichonephila clavata]|uniref:Uncharacterized protein n=1 Tax=Trichonephila clavata TaxID=2740835 RepID=A0A8X6FHE3_TRICU|nr:hypothetical protein TNCT_347681 [Trichonephila clavata]